MLTNSNSQKKPGPKEIDAGALYSFAHQAYWGFRFLAEKRPTLWKRVVLAAGSIAEVRDIGRICSRPQVMTGAGYGAAGLMTWLDNKRVGIQVLAAKKHRRYPGSKRPSSEDRRMIFLGIAVTAGVWDVEFSTALRKLAQAGLGPRHLTREVHRTDCITENMRRSAFIWAEPVESYFFSPSEGIWDQMRDLPCQVPANFQGGFIIHGFGPKGPMSAFSRALPQELME